MSVVRSPERISASRVCKDVLAVFVSECLDGVEPYRRDQVNVLIFRENGDPRTTHEDWLEQHSTLFTKHAVTDTLGSVAPARAG